MKYLFLSLILFYHCLCLARDLFNFDENLTLNSPLLNIQRENLIFIGSIIGNNESAAFLEDNLGNIYRVRLGQVIGSEKNKVIKILSDAIFLSNGQEFSVIK